MKFQVAISNPTPLLIKINSVKTIIFKNNLYQLNKLTISKIKTIKTTKNKQKIIVLLLLILNYLI